MRSAPRKLAQLVLGAAATLSAASSSQAAPSVPRGAATPDLQDVAPLPVEGARDVTGSGRAFVELSASPESPFQHEPVTLRLRFGFEPGFLREELIQPFRRPLDVPAQVQAAWLDAPDCATALDPLPQADAPAHPRRSFALNRTLAQARLLAEVELDGRPTTVLELERRFLPTCAGTLTIPAPLLRFAYATSFREDLLHGRLPEDRVDAFVRGEPLVLTVRPLPETGRPAGFSGAVGRFTVAAAAEPRELEVRESLRLSLVIEGEGDLQHFDAPRLDDLPGLRLRGWVEERTSTRRTVVYDLTPESTELTQVPPIRFTFFDPTPPAGYRSVATEPLPLVVRPRAAPSTPVGVAGGGPHDPGVGFRSAGSALVLVAIGALACLALMVGAVLFLLARRRARATPPPHPLGERVRAAAAAFRAEQERPQAATDQTFARFVSACLEMPVTAAIGSDLRPRLLDSGAPAELADRIAALLEALVGARYGGPSPPDSERAARELVDALETWAAGLDARG